MPIGILAPEVTGIPLGILASKNNKMTIFQLQIIQLSHALSQKKDIDIITGYLYKIRDSYLQNIENIDYLHLYPTPQYVVWETVIGLGLGILLT